MLQLRSWTMNFKPETDHSLFESLRTLRNQREDGTLVHSAYENEVTKLLAQRIYNASPPPPALYPHARETIPPKVYFCWDSNVHRIKALTFPGNLPHGTRMLFQCKNSLEALHLCRPGMLDSLLAAHCTFPPFSPVMDVLPRARPIEKPSFGTCNSCGKPAGLLCSKCKIVCYCSFACQKKDWSEHKLKCDSLLRGKRLDELIAADALATVSDESGVAAAPEVIPPVKKYVHGYRLLQSSSGSFVHVVYCEREGMQHALNEYAKLLLEPVVQQNAGKTGAATKQASYITLCIYLTFTHVLLPQPAWSLMCCTHDIPGFAPSVASVRHATSPSSLYVLVSHCITEILRRSRRNTVHAVLQLNRTRAEPVGGVRAAQHVGSSRKCRSVVLDSQLHAMFATGYSHSRAPFV